ncbi:MAG: hypothetical protein EAY65_07260 [Alphaproteobacteria bacterium]|nr:MAG: hypothetical protein EAY65_07260 [Alphaproteobacteria bacterium]
MLKNSQDIVTSWCRLCGFVVVLWVVLILVAPDHANSAPLPMKPSEAMQDAFEKSYAHPEDVDAALRYAKEAIAHGDYESAVAPLERVLMFNSKLASVRLEVGVMYYLLNAHKAAEVHLYQVVTDPKADDDLKKRAYSYLEKM